MNIIDNNFLVLITTIGCALITGMFFVFSNFVMTALGRIPPDQGIATMQAINISVINFGFLMVFLGTAVGCLLLIFNILIMHTNPDNIFIVLGSVVYLLGTILVTVVFNIPLNNKLESIESTREEDLKLWNLYLKTWTYWNSVRTAASFAAMVFLILSIINSKIT